MKIPGFTAEASLDRTVVAYQSQALRNRFDSGVYPSQSLFTNRDYLSSIRWQWPIVEPNCTRICLPQWGGHCRWICF